MIAIFGVNQVIGSFRSGPHKRIRHVGCHRAQTGGAMGALSIDRCGSIHKVTSTQQTSFLTHIVETMMNVGTDKTTIEDGDNHAFPLKTLFMKHLCIQLGDLGVASAIITSCSHTRGYWS